jgi:hypothetical protein
MCTLVRCRHALSPTPLLSETIEHHCTPSNAIAHHRTPSNTIEHHRTPWQMSADMDFEEMAAVVDSVGTA